MKRDLRVCLLDPWGSGGITVFYSMLARELTAAGATVDAFCYMRTWADMELLAPYCGRLGMAPESLVEFLVAEDYTVVHGSTDCVLPPFDAQTAIRRARSQAALIVTAHQPLRPETKFPLASIAGVAAVSEAIARDMTTKLSTPVTFVPNGIDVERFASTDVSSDLPRAPKPVIAWIGRADDDYQKDVRGFLLLAAAMGDAYDYWIADGSPEIPPVMRDLPDWFGNGVRHCHRLSRSQLAAFLHRVASSGGCLVMTSRHEASPLVLLEAWAAGCPTVVPDVVGFEEAVETGCSLIYPRANGLQRMREQCLRLLSDTTLREQLVERAREQVMTRHTAEAMAGHYLRMYEDVAESSRIRRSATSSAVGRGWATALRLQRIVRRA